MSPTAPRSERPRARRRLHYLRRLDSRQIRHRLRHGIGCYTELCKGTDIGDHADIGDGVPVDKDVEAGDNFIVGGRNTVKRYVIFGYDVTLSDDTAVGIRVEICNGSVIS